MNTIKKLAAHKRLSVAIIAALGIIGTAAAVIASPAVTAGPAEIKAIPLTKAFLAGKTLTAIAPYKKEVTISGMQQLSVAEGFSGAFSVLVLNSADGGTLKIDNYPFDHYVHVLAGSTTLTSASGASQTFAKGDSFVLPKGFTGSWHVSKGFRELMILDADQLKAGIGQFEN